MKLIALDRSGPAPKKTKLAPKAGTKSSTAATKESKIAKPKKISRLRSTLIEPDTNVDGQSDDLKLGSSRQRSIAKDKTNFEGERQSEHRANTESPQKSRKHDTRTSSTAGAATEDPVIAPVNENEANGASHSSSSDQVG